MGIGECERGFVFREVLWDHTGAVKSILDDSAVIDIECDRVVRCLDIGGTLGGTLLGNPQGIQEATLMDTYSNWNSTRSNQWTLSFQSCNAGMAGRL